MTSIKYDRNFFDCFDDKRPGRINPQIFNYSQNGGDGIPGLQWILYKTLARLGEFFVIEGCVYDEADAITSGYIFMNGDVVEVSIQNGLGALTDGQCIYIDSSGTATRGAMNNDVLNNDVITAFQKHGTVQHCGQPGSNNSLILGGDIDVGHIEANSINLLPIGTVLMYDSGEIKGNILTRDYEISKSNNDEISLRGWFVCNGQGGTPNFQDRFVICENDNNNNTGGLDTVTLVENEIPSHNHGVTVNNDIHDHIAGSIIDGQTETGGDPNHAHTFDSGLVTTGTQSSDHTHTHTHGEFTNSTAKHSHTISGSTNTTSNHTHTITLAGGAKMVYMPGNQRYINPSNVNADSGYTYTCSYGSHTHILSGESFVGVGDHTHTVDLPNIVSGNASADHTHIATVDSATNDTNIQHNHTITVQNDTHNHTASSVNIGGSTGHENRPSFYSLIFIKRIT